MKTVPIIFTIKRPYTLFLIRLFGLTAAAFLFTCTGVPAVADTVRDDALVTAFASPPLETRPGCYWYWMNGRISKEGITKDLESMSQVGIGRAYIGIIGGNAAGRDILTALSEPWWAAVRHAIREAGRVGVDIGFFNAPGWSQSGGPWVKPEEAMRYVSSSESKLKGPQMFSGIIPKPDGAIQEVAVLAYPVPQFDDQMVPERERTATSVTFESGDPVTIRSAILQCTKPTSGKADLEISEDGKTYRKITSVMVSRGLPQPRVGPILLAPVVASFPPVTGKYFRLRFSQTACLGEIRLSSALRNGSVYEKQLGKMCESQWPRHNYYSWPSQPDPAEAGLAVPGKEIRNLSSLLKPDGTLEWEVPPGEWIVQRVALGPTGARNGPAPAEATGLEVDKMNREWLRRHFDAYVGKLLASMPSEERKALKYAIVDSYEVGSQNWTDGFADIFHKRYGYDPLPWLAVLTGRVVDTPEKSDRFLWDLRRLVADRIATEYVGGLRDLSHEKGMTIWVENYGHWGFPCEFLQYGGQADEFGGEFAPPIEQMRKFNMEVRCASSAGHIYGKNRIWCESYTGGPLFMNTPRELKAMGDWSFSQGANQAVLHLYVHQTLDRQGQGNWASFGTEFNRNNTWWDLAMKPWIDYQRRCSVMLQAGKPVADVAYFIGEDVPKMTGSREPALPEGYDYDSINAEVIQTRLSVKEGRLVLPEGTSYRLLVLPPLETMRPDVLRKLKTLVAAGATVVGPAPQKSPSLENYPRCDADVQALAKDLWGSGKIRAVKDLYSVLACGPDVVVPEGVVWKHRSDGDREIYFIANQEEKVCDRKITFRVKGKEPELWWPESGKTEPAPAFRLQGDRVEVPLHLEPLTSVFVVFEKEATQDRAAAQMPKPPAAQEITGPWEVQFGDKKVTLEKLMPWPEHTDPQIKYYSGEAVYRKEIDLLEIKPDMTLDLGAVNAVASVRLNGLSLGARWKPPYQVKLSPALKIGINRLEITVVHTWHNRMIGDVQPGAPPTGFRKLGKPTDELQPSGLLGPVRLLETNETACNNTERGNEWNRVIGMGGRELRTTVVDRAPAVLLDLDNCLTRSPAAMAMTAGGTSWTSSTKSNRVAGQTQTVCGTSGRKATEFSEMVS